jgi:acetyltransferase-like isoleucine patch superfamily enzyme
MGASDNFLIRNDPNFIELRRTLEVCAFFNDHAILFSNKQRLEPDLNQFVRVTKHGAVEEFSLFADNFAHPMGAFSYNHSRVINLKCRRYCSIGAGLKVFGERHPVEWVTTSNITYCFSPNWNKPNFLRAHADLMDGRWSPTTPPGTWGADPILEDDVWIATDVTLARGITIGTGAIVGCGSIVTRDVEPYTIVGGNPARVIRRRFSDTICDRLLKSRWWNLHPDVLFKFNSHDPIEFLDQIEGGEVAACPARSFEWQNVLDEISMAASKG